MTLIVVVGVFVGMPGHYEALRGQDGPAFLGIFAMLGAAYLYVACSLELTSTTVVIRNPLRRVDIPLAHIESVEPGSNLVVTAGYRSFVAVGVEAANVQLFRGTQAPLARRIRRAARRTTAGSPVVPVGYRWAWPDPFAIVLAGVDLVTVAVLLVNGGPITT